MESLDRLRLPPDHSQWFRNALTSAMGDRAERQRRQQASLTKRKNEIQSMQDRLLNAYLGGSIDEGTYQAKAGLLKTQSADVAEAMSGMSKYDVQVNIWAPLAIFDWTQRAADLWRGSNFENKRRVLNWVCLNRHVDDVSVRLEWRRPFDLLAERPSVPSSRSTGICTPSLRRREVDQQRQPGQEDRPQHDVFPRLPARRSPMRQASRTTSRSGRRSSGSGKTVSG